MRAISDLGRRIELVSMDPRFQEISIALYRQDRADGRVAVVHTYSSKPGVEGRIAFVAKAMVGLGGLVATDDETDAVRLPCAGWHETALRRTFLEACKADPSLPVEVRGLETEDRRTRQQIRIEALGAGAYRVHADGVSEEESRAPAAANGLAKLGQLVLDDDGETVTFPCRTDHDALVGLLLPRALNVRAALREEEAAAARGVLVAPSAQEGAMTP